MNMETNGGAAETDPTRVEALLGKTITDIGIPPCPATLTQINVEMSKDEPDLRHLDSLICSDVGLSAGLIALANSPFFGSRRRVSSVNGALLMLGLDVSSRAVAGLILRKVFPTSPAMERFWDASAHIASLSGWLVHDGGISLRARSDVAYTFGLFRDCGIPILMKRYPQYSETLKRANDNREGRFTDAEDAAYGTNHAAVGCLLAQAWWLPDDIFLAIRHHHDFGDIAANLSPVSLDLIAVTQLAEHLFQKHTGLSRNEEWEKVGSACLARLGINEERLAALYEKSLPIATATI